MLNRVRIPIWRRSGAMFLKPGWKCGAKSKGEIALLSISGGALAGLFFRTIPKPFQGEKPALRILRKRRDCRA